MESAATGKDMYALIEEAWDLYVRTKQGSGAAEPVPRRTLAEFKIGDLPSELVAELSKLFKSNDKHDKALVTLLMAHLERRTKERNRLAHLGPKGGD